MQVSQRKIEIVWFGSGWVGLVKLSNGYNLGDGTGDVILIQLSEIFS